MGGLEEDPDYYELCQQTVRMLRIDDVVFTGSVNVVEYLPRMDLLMLSSISEGQPLAVLEGQAAHRPFITTDVGCCRELIYGGQDDTLGAAGAVVAPMDFEAMAAQMVRLWRDFSLRRFAANFDPDELDRAGYSVTDVARIKQQLDHYVKVREIVRRASGESLDLKAYEADMRHLIDTYIEAKVPRKISQFDDMPLLELIVKTEFSQSICICKSRKHCYCCRNHK